MKQIILIPLGATHGENSNKVFKAPLHAKAVANVLNIKLTDEQANKIAEAFVEMSGKDYSEHVQKACEILEIEFSEDMVADCNQELNKLSSEGCSTVCNPEISQSFSLKANSDFVEFMQKANEQDILVMLVSNGKNDAATPKAQGTESLVVLSQGQAKLLINTGNAIMIVNHANTNTNLEKNGIKAVFVEGQKLADFIFI